MRLSDPRSLKTNRCACTSRANYMYATHLVTPFHSIAPLLEVCWQYLTISCDQFNGQFRSSYAAHVCISILIFEESQHRLILGFCHFFPGSELFNPRMWSCGSVGDFGAKPPFKRSGEINTYHLKSKSPMSAGVLVGVKNMHGHHRISEGLIFRAALHAVVLIKGPQNLRSDLVDMAYESQTRRILPGQHSASFCFIAQNSCTRIMWLEWNRFELIWTHLHTMDAYVLHTAYAHKYTSTCQQCRTMSYTMSVHSSVSMRKTHHEWRYWLLGKPDGCIATMLDLRIRKRPYLQPF